MSCNNAVWTLSAEGFDRSALWTFSRCKQQFRWSFPCLRHPLLCQRKPSKKQTREWVSKESRDLANKKIPCRTSYAWPLLGFCLEWRVPTLLVTPGCPQSAAVVMPFWTKRWVALSSCDLLSQLGFPLSQYSFMFSYRHFPYLTWPVGSQHLQPSFLFNSKLSKCNLRCDVPWAVFYAGQLLPTDVDSFSFSGQTIAPRIQKEGDAKDDTAVVVGIR